MSPRTHIASGSVWMLVVLVVALGVSCVRIPTRSPKDYIGPSGGAATTDTVKTAKPDEPGKAVAPETTTGTLRVGVLEAILASLENNRSLRVERLNPEILRTFEQEQRAVFDPVLTAQASKNRALSQRLASSGTGIEASRSENTIGDATISTFLPTGTRVDLEAGAQSTRSSLYDDSFASMRGGLTVTQSILRGFGIGVNLASLRQARLDTLTSQYELRGFVEALVAQIERTYWDFSLAQRQIEIFSDSLKLAEQQQQETQERINVGRLAEAELAAAQAEVALRREGLINARSNLAKTRLLLLRLLNPQGANQWDREVVLLDQPIVPDSPMDDVETHVQVAQRLRPELNQARLAIQRGELEVVKTRNGLLPRLDAFLTLGKSGYADTFHNAFNTIDDIEAYDVTYGAAFEYPLGNRRPQALHKRAALSLDQSQEALANLAQLVDIDVRSAYIEVNRTQEQVIATAATRKLREETLRAETEKFRVGRSTALLVAQAGRDLLASQIAEVEAVTNHLKALIELYRLEGSLLERRGISAPGRERVDLSLHPTWWK